MMLVKPDNDVILIQSADPFVYFKMLRLTSKITQLYCQQQDIHYEAHYGIVRGFHPWHACFNRIYMFANLIDLGFKGWYIHLDADAWVQDANYNLRQYLGDLRKTSFVFTPGGDQGIWDVNDGIFFANCAHPDTKEVALAWREHALASSTSQLRAASHWQQIPCDQMLLHTVLQQDDNRLCAAIHIEDPRFINGPGPGTRFIRQVLRSAYDDADKRVDQIELGAERALAQQASRPDEAIEAFCALARALEIPIPSDRELVRKIMASKASLTKFLQPFIAI
jgi:hypothetical protein